MEGRKGRKEGGREGGKEGRKREREGGEIAFSKASQYFISFESLQ